VTAEADKEKILHEAHIILGHGTKNAMKFFLENRVKWDGIFKDIDKVVNSCVICLKNGDELCNTKNKVIETKRFGEIWEVDLLGRIQNKDGSNKFILVAIDHFTKWVEATIISNKNEELVVWQ
jgi:hypothetical protein